MPKAKNRINPRTIPVGKTQVNFNIRNDLLEKVKYMVYVSKDRITNSDVYNEAVDKFTTAYEKKHGKIKPPREE